MSFLNFLLRMYEKFSFRALSIFGVKIAHAWEGKRFSFEILLQFSQQIIWI